MVKFIKSGIILALFCAVSAWLLAKVFIYAQPIIEENARIAYERAVAEVLAGEPGQAVLVSPRGYSGPISLLVGVSPDQKVLGLKILSQRETPGLGNKIIKEKFLKQFTGKTAADPLEPKKDLDAVTGATISSRAVAKGVREALEKTTP